MSDDLQTGYGSRPRSAEKPIAVKEMDFTALNRGELAPAGVLLQSREPGLCTGERLSAG